MKGSAFLLVASIILLCELAASAQQGAAGRAEPPPATRSETRVRRASRPVVRRTPPKRTVPAAKTAEQLQAEGDKFFDADDHDSALAAYERAVKIRPMLRSLYRIGRINNEFKEYGKAIAALEKALKISTKEAPVYLELGYAQRRLDRNADALISLKRSVALDPNFHIATFELGALYNDLGRYSDAALVLHTSISNRSDYAESYEELGFAQRMLGQNSESLASFNRSIALDAANAGALMGLGDTYFYGTKQYPQAIAAYKRGLQYNPTNHVATYNIAYSNNELGNHAEALKWADETIRLKPDYYLAFSEAGYANLKLKNDQAAITAYRSALRLKPDHDASYFGLGDVYFDNLKNYEQALANYTKGLAINPNNRWALYRSGWSYNHFKQYQHAADVLHKLIGMNDKPSEYHQEIGFTYWQLDRIPEAIDSLNRAISINRDQPVSHFYLGQIYVGQQDRDSAMASYRELLRLKSQYAPRLLERINGMQSN